MAVSQKKIISNHRYDEKAYDKFNVRLPKGSRELILSTGDTLNGFLNKAFKEYCENHNIGKGTE